MTDTNQEPHYTENVQEHLKQVEALLHKHALLEDVIHRQELPRGDRHALLDTLVHKQHLAELRRKLDSLRRSSTRGCLCTKVSSNAWRSPRGNS